MYIIGMKESKQSAVTATPAFRPVRRIIPCLDVRDGRVVKGVNFVSLADAGDPVEAAALYDRQGADELVFLDITASSDGRATMIDVVRRAAPRNSFSSRSPSGEASANPPTSAGCFRRGPTSVRSTPPRC